MIKKSFPKNTVLCKYFPGHICIESPDSSVVSNAFLNFVAFRHNTLFIRENFILIVIET